MVGGSSPSLPPPLSWLPYCGVGVGIKVRRVKGTMMYDSKVCATWKVVAKLTVLGPEVEIVMVSRGLIIMTPGYREVSTFGKDLRKS